jgi:hypothetical protein
MEYFILHNQNKMLKKEKRKKRWGGIGGQMSRILNEVNFPST